MDKEIETRLAKASTVFSLLRNTIWYRKSVSFEAKLWIFRACVLPVLLYGSEVWTLNVTQERRINIFYIKCLRTIIEVNLTLFLYSRLTFMYLYKVSSNM